MCPFLDTQQITYHSNTSVHLRQITQLYVKYQKVKNQTNNSLTFDTSLTDMHLLISIIKFF